MIFIVEEGKSFQFIQCSCVAHKIKKTKIDYCVKTLYVVLATFVKKIKKNLHASVGILQRNGTEWGERERRSVCVCVYVKRFIIRNWLLQLWKLTSPQICRASWQAGGPGKAEVSV